MAICPDCFKEGFLGGRCKTCGFVGLAHEENHMLLSPGMILNNRYTVGRTLGAGGFGVTYLVMDNQSGQRMAAKEYLPASFAVRDGNSKRVYASGADNEEIFTHGLEVFDREAESLRLFLGNPSVVQVTDSFRQNGTSYYIMEFLDGVNLKALSRTMGGRLDIGLAIEVVQSIGATLSAVHQKGMLHRDVSPENIFVTKQGLIKLIDFGLLVCAWSFCGFTRRNIGRKAGLTKDWMAFVPFARTVYFLEAIGEQWWKMFIFEMWLFYYWLIGQLFGLFNNPTMTTFGNVIGALYLLAVLVYKIYFRIKFYKTFNIKSDLLFWRGDRNHRRPIKPQI